MNCPQCKQQVKKRKNETCPHCGQAISIYKGQYYRTEDGAPPMQIIAAFEKYVSQFLSKKQNVTVPFRVSRKGNKWAMELRAAENILAECDDDLDLALRTINQLFENQLWAWKSRASLYHLTKDLPAAKAIASVAQQAATAEYVREQVIALQLENKEDIFK
jgi:hypothetical protein